MLTVVLGNILVWSNNCNDSTSKVTSVKMNFVNIQNVNCWQPQVCPLKIKQSGLPLLTQHEDSKCSWCARFKIRLSHSKSLQHFMSWNNIRFRTINQYHEHILSAEIGHEILHKDTVRSLHDIMYIFFYFSIIHYSLINVDKLDLKTAKSS